MKVGTDGVLLGAWSELPKAGVQEFRGSGVTTEQAQSAAEHLNSSVVVSEYHYKANVLDSKDFQMALLVLRQEKQKLETGNK